MNDIPARGLIAEDEPLLAAALRSSLQRAWPALQIVGVVGDGETAVRASLELQPDVLFFDIRMPGLSGLDAAEQLAEAWPESPAFPLLVFVTAYDQYAIEAFERAAADYLLKPVDPQRLMHCCERLRQALQLRRSAATPPLEDALAPLRRLLADTKPAPDAAKPRLRLIPAGVGQTVKMIPIDEVLAFEAADKYVLVLTRDGETPIRTPLKELLPQLDPDVFWQIHRGTVVRADAIESAVRDESGRVSLRLHGLARALPVSRLYAHRFRPL
ncbi:MAG: LytR/AlgR family response regulator transcription factor [Burkholderiaceae bacterium]